MRHSVKLRIAKEIIILFSSLLLIGVVWLLTLAINHININRIASLKIEIELFNKTIDSIQSTFPKVQTLDRLFLSNVPKDFYIETGDKDEFGIPIKRLVKYDELKILGDSFEEDIQTTNLRVLYHILEKSDYPFEVSPFNKYDLPMFKDFQDNIKKELSGDTLNLDKETKPNLERIFYFLKGKQYLKTEFSDFVVTIVGLPLPPSHETWLSYLDKKDKLETLTAELILKKAKLIPVDHITNLTIVLVAVIVYPVRLIILTLWWAIKTVRRPEQE